MARQIEMNYKTESGYEVLYPQNAISNLIIDNQTIQQAQIYRFEEIKSGTYTSPNVTPTNVVYYNNMFCFLAYPYLYKSSDCFTWESIEVPNIPQYQSWGRSYSRLTIIDGVFYFIGSNYQNYYIFVGDGETFSIKYTFSNLNKISTVGFVPSGDNIILLINGVSSTGQSIATNIYYYSNNKGQTWLQGTHSSSVVFYSGSAFLSNKISIIKESLYKDGYCLFNGGSQYEIIRLQEYNSISIIPANNSDCFYIRGQNKDNLKTYLLKSTNGEEWQIISEIHSNYSNILKYNNVYYCVYDNIIEITKDFNCFFKLNLNNIGAVGNVFCYVSESGVEVFLKISSGSSYYRGRIIPNYWIKSTDSLGSILNILYYKLNNIEVDL